MLSNNRVPLGSRPVSFSILLILICHFVPLIETVRVESPEASSPVRGRKLPVKRTSGGGSGLICADVRAGHRRKISNKTILAMGSLHYSSEQHISGSTVRHENVHDSSCHWSVLLLYHSGLPNDKQAC